MIPLIFAGFIIFGCVAASARRLWLAADATALDLKLLRNAIDVSGVAPIAKSISQEPLAIWERDVFSAARLSGSEQAAAMNEALAEVDFRLARWSRVPRVCASISSSTGFLCGALALRSGLAQVDAVTDAAIDQTLNGAVAHALGVAAFGLAATVACIALDSEARKIVKSRRLAADLLIERLERTPSEAPSADRAELRAGV